MRPNTLDEFVNSEAVKNTIRFNAEASKIRGIPFPHTIITGKAGTGKSTISRIIANIMGQECRELFGPSFRLDALFKMIREMKENSILIIDEAHRLGNNAEQLYCILEDSVMYLPNLHGKIRVKPLTIIAVTKEIGMLDQSFIDRFKLKIELDLYNVDDLSVIIQQNATLPVTKEARMFIAGISRSTPRIAIDYIYQIENYCIANKLDEITIDITIRALQSYGIDRYGFNHVQRSIIKILGNTYTGQAVGLNTLSNLVGKSPVDIESSFEGYLLERNIIQKTKSGRILTTVGYDILDNLGE